MAKYPIYLDLVDMQAVVIGAGSIAARKAKTLLNAGAKVRVIAKEFKNDFLELANTGSIETIKSPYSKEYLRDAFLVIAATDDSDLNKEVFNDCQAMKVPCNVVDVPGLCNFYVPSIVQKGDIQIAISTNGKCPAFAAKLRRELEQIITEDHARFLDSLATIRKKIIESGIEPAKRKELLVSLAEDKSFDFFITNGQEAWASMAEEELRTSQEK